MRKSKRFQKTLTVVLALCIIASVALTTAVLSDRVSHKMQFTTATFSFDGYTLTRVAPEGPFAAGEDIAVTLTESNTGNVDIKSDITISVEWASPDTALSVFGNAKAEDNATITLGSDPVNYTVNQDGTITFTLEDHALTAGAKDVERELVFHIPESFKSTGKLLFTFDKVVLKNKTGSYTQEFNRDQLNAAASLDFTERVGWAASSDPSKQNGKSLMGFLTEKDASGKFGIEFGMEFNYSESAMKDFTSKTDAKWSYYNNSVNRLTFSEGVTTIGDYAFADFESVTSISLPESLTAVGTWAFDNTSIEKLTIPEKTQTFETMSFGHINELTEITFNAAETKDISFPTAGSETGAFYVYPYVDTTIKGANTDAQTYDWIKDLRNPPTLAASRDWIDTDQITMFGSPGNPVTKVIFTTSYTPTGNETDVWNAAVDRNGDGENDDDIICYLKGTELTFYAHTATRIFANEDSYNAFYGFKKTTAYENIEMLDTSKAVDMHGMFSDNYVVTDLEVGHFDTGSAKDLSQLFYLCYQLPSLDVSNWDTSNAENMSGMFSNCNALAAPTGIQNWDTRNVQVTASMFDGCTGMTSLDLTSKPVTVNGKSYDSWHTKSLVNMDSMFGNTDDSAHALQTLKINTFDTRNVTTLKLTFERCYSLQDLDLAPRQITLNGETFYSWDTGKVESMYGTFRNCTSLPSLDLSGWDTSGIGTGENYSDDDFIEMFLNCTSLQTLNVGRKAMNNFNGRNVTSWDTSNAVFMRSMFENCSSLQSLNLKNWKNTAATEMTGMFSECSSMKSIDLTGFTTPSATYMSTMFYKCSSLEAIDVTSFDTSNAEYMYNTFSYCSSLKELDLSNWDTRNVWSSYFQRFAQHCTSLTTIILGENFGQAGTVPSAGSNGLFYVTDPHSASNPLVTNVIEANDVMTAYNWSTDNRAATHLKKGLNIVTPPNDADYIVGEDFDPTGIKVVIVSPDGTIEDVTDKVTYPDGEDLKIAQNKVTVEYEDEDGNTYSATTPIVVSNPLVGLRVETPPTTMDYIVTDDFDPAGMKVVAVYKNGSTKDVTDSITLKDHEDLKVGQEKVTIEYTEGGVTVSATTPITVSNPIVGIQIVTPPTKTAYFAGDDFEPAGMKVVAVYKDGTTADITDQITVTDGKDLQAGQEKVAIQYAPAAGSSFTATTPITVKGIPVLAPSDTWFTQGGTTVKRADITEIEIKDSYTPTGTVTASWDASAAKDKSVMAYVEGTKLTIAGNGSGSIQLSSDASNIFSDSANKDRFTNLKTLSGANLLDTSNVTNLAYAFRLCGLTTVDVSSWNVEKVTSLSSTFYGCYSLDSLNLTNWNVEKVENMYSTFWGCSKLESIGDISNWKTNSLTNTKRLFFDCNVLESITGAAKWNMSKVTDMDGMFQNNRVVTSLDLSNWDTGNVTNMSTVFRGCHALKELNLAGWDTTKAVSMVEIFYDMPKLEKVTLGEKFCFNGDGTITTAAVLPTPSSEHISGATGKWYRVSDDAAFAPADVPSNEAATYVAYPNHLTLAASYNWYSQGGTSVNKNTIKEIEIADSYTPTGSETASWDASAAKDGSVMAYVNGTKLTLAGNGSGYICANPNSNQAFSNFRNLQIITGGNLLNTSKVTDMSKMFFMSTLKSLDVSKWDTSKAENMSDMFYDCANLTTLDVSAWDTTSCTNMSFMFADCYALETLNVSTWDVSSVKNMCGMFHNSSSLESLDLSAWNPSACTAMNTMFFGCKSLSTIGDVSDWDVSKVTTMQGMFYASGVESLDLSAWDTNSLTDIYSMFQNCSNLTSLNLNGWNTNNFNLSNCWNNLFNGCSSLTAVDVNGWATPSNSYYAAGSFAGCNATGLKIYVSNYATKSVLEASAGFPSTTATVVIGTMPAATMSLAYDASTGSVNGYTVDE